MKFSRAFLCILGIFTLGFFHAQESSASAVLLFPPGTQGKVFERWSTTLPNQFDFMTSLLFPEKEFTTAAPIDLDQHHLDLGRFRGTAQELINTIKNWVSPFPVQDPKPHALLHDLQFQLEWGQLMARVNTQKSREWVAANGRDGVVFDIHGVIPKIDAWLGEAILSDQENTFLQQIIFKDMSAYMRATSVPLTFDSTATLSFDRDPETQAPRPRIEVGPIDNNLEDLDIVLNYRGQVQVPVIQLIINGRRFRLRGERVQSHVQDHLEEITDFLQRLVQSKGRTGIAGSLARTLNELFPTSPTFHLDIHEPSPAVLPITPINITVSQNASLGIELQTDPNEPYKDWKGAIRSLEQRASQQRIQARTRELFYVGMSLPMIQKMIDQAFASGKWENMSVPGLSRVSLTRSPVLRAGTDGNFTIDLHVSTEVSGIRNFFLRDPFEFSFRATTRWSTTEPGRLELAQAQVDSLHIARDRIKRMPRIVTRNIKKKIKNWNKHLAREPFVLMNGFPFPEEMLGFLFKTKNAQVDPETNTLWVQIAIE